MSCRYVALDRSLQIYIFHLKWMKAISKNFIGQWKPGNIFVNISASKMVVLVFIYLLALAPKSVSGSRTIQSFSEFCHVSRRWKYDRKAWKRICKPVNFPRSQDSVKQGLQIPDWDNSRLWYMWSVIHFFHMFYSFQFRSFLRKFC